MNQIEQTFHKIITEERDPRRAAARLAFIVQESVRLIVERHQADANKFAEFQKLVNLFYAAEGRIAATLEAVDLLDQGLKRSEMRDVLRDRAIKHHGDMTHYHTLMRLHL